ncbi:hypothetical protein OCO_46820 [Mycobacterium intracellulare MOTT-02]|uniref:Uncharacterized protein n=1 Tax=Mycobacterium intracellulare 1956 TaxID=1299331 RepID=X8CAY5_MYCIT|nr:hypothetical protein OCO_46820 [Mycobacterium intracellulare MOTT-02]ASW88393.1 hypothetical protein CKJ61_23175 [Mycobacterium intracellulare]EUA28878.1 hypothetical protein I548_2063 [Mycobacterium intracellulare]EUA53502.1 hypothetical protein I550_5138 [Mycobacterium intracellulare 1956]PBA29702.1 hypothetical protein CKJ65_23200 [Mycobacterium intracellulare]
MARHASTVRRRTHERRGRRARGCAARRSHRACRRSRRNRKCVRPSRSRRLWGRHNPKWRVW